LASTDWGTGLPKYHVANATHGTTPTAMQAPARTAARGSPRATRRRCNAAINTPSGRSRTAAVAAAVRQPLRGRSLGARQYTVAKTTSDVSMHPTTGKSASGAQAYKLPVI